MLEDCVRACMFVNARIVFYHAVCVLLCLCVCVCVYVCVVPNGALFPLQAMRPRSGACHMPRYSCKSLQSWKKTYLCAREIFFLGQEWSRIFLWDSLVGCHECIWIVECRHLYLNYANSCVLSKTINIFFQQKPLVYMAMFRESMLTDAWCARSKIKTSPRKFGRTLHWK